MDLQKLLTDLQAIVTEVETAIAAQAMPPAAEGPDAPTDSDVPETPPAV